MAYRVYRNLYKQEFARVCRCKLSVNPIRGDQSLLFRCISSSNPSLRTKQKASLSRQVSFPHETAEEQEIDAQLCESAWEHHLANKKKKDKPKPKMEKENSYMMFVAKLENYVKLPLQQVKHFKNKAQRKVNLIRQNSMDNLKENFLQWEGHMSPFAPFEREVKTKVTPKKGFKRQNSLPHELAEAEELESQTIFMPPTNIKGGTPYGYSAWEMQKQKTLQKAQAKALKQREGYIYHPPSRNRSL